MTFGRYSRFPLTLGGATSTIKLIEKDMLAAAGSGVTQKVNSVAGAKALAAAKVLAEAFQTVQVFANQNIPEKMTVHLERWESIFNLVPRPSDSPTERRQEISRRIRYLALPITRSNLELSLAEVLGDVFIGLELDVYADGYSAQSVDGGMDLGSYSSIDYSAGNYTSTICNVRIIVDAYGGQDAADFERIIKKLSLLDDWLPAWMQYQFTTDYPFTLDAEAWEDHLALDMAYLSESEA